MGLVQEGTVLGIESSCDDTAAAVVTAGRTVHSSVVSSQVEIHARFGGVVPEIAGRAHIEAISSVVDEALSSSPLRGGGPPVEAVAATSGPGLIGSLLVGLSMAKGLARSWDVPFVGVNHLEAHLFAPLLERPDLEWPAMVLLVSGGHTVLVEMAGPGRYCVIGQTIDDAAGEAFDKVARYLGLGYPGGPAIDHLAKQGDPTAIPFPRALQDDEFNWSFSGLKTSVIRTVDRHANLGEADVAASFQEAVVDALMTKVARAIVARGARTLCLAGGVAANSALRQRAVHVADRLGIDVQLPAMAMCTDNAAMVAAAGWWQLCHHGPSPMSLAADPTLFFPRGQ